MKVEVRDAEKSQKELSVELSVEEFELVFEAEYDKTIEKVKVDGFRQGKAPREAVLKKHGHSIRVQALEKLINDSVFAAMDKEGIKSLGNPDIKDVKFEEGEPVTYRAYVDVFPVVAPEKIGGFEFTKEKVIISDADVDNVIENIRKNQATFQPVEGRAVKEGDLTVIDFEGRKDGVVIPSATAQNYELEIGSKTFIPGFEEQLVGMDLGEEKDIEVTFPENYQEPSLAGQLVVFGIKMKEIKEKVLPEIDDEFAKDVDGKFETLAMLKETILDELEENSERQADDKLLNDILNKIIDENPFDIPMAMVKDQALRLAQQTLQQYSAYGMDPARFGLTPESVAEQHMETAEKQVKGALIINHITDANGLAVTDEDMEEALKKYAKKSRMEYDEYKAEVEKQKGMPGLRNSLNTDKVTKFLAEMNSVELKTLTREEVEARHKAAQEKAAQEQAEADSAGE
jgi:trigger factor